MSDLTQEQKKNLEHVAKRLLEMADIVFLSPFDPKIATFLRMAADLAKEQVSLNKFYDYSNDNEEPDYKFLDQDDSMRESKDVAVKPQPSPNKIMDDDIHKWLDGPSEDNND